jgi:CheY-like chemotaxis protein
MRTVLIVEDDEELREALRRTLEDEGVRCECASDGGEALARLQSSEPGRRWLVLLDLMMPGMNGWEFRARQLADERLREIPVVVMSATENLEEAAISAEDVLHKPVGLPELIRTVARHLAGDDFAEDIKTQPQGRPPYARDGEAVPSEIEPHDTTPTFTEN